MKNNKTHKKALNVRFKAGYNIAKAEILIKASVLFIAVCSVFYGALALIVLLNR